MTHQRSWQTAMLICIKSIIVKNYCCLHFKKIYVQHYIQSTTRFSTFLFNHIKHFACLHIKYDWFYFEKVVKSIKTVYLPRELKVQNSTAHITTSSMFINITIILPGFSLFKHSNVLAFNR